MKYFRCIFACLIFSLGFCCKGYCQMLFEKDYRLRCDTVLNSFSAKAGPRNLFSVMAKYAIGKATGSTAKLLDSLLEHPSGNMFWMYPVTGVYFYGNENLSSSKKNKIIHSFAQYDADTGITENHKLMYYSSLFLMSGEDEKDTVHWFNKRSSASNHQFAGAILKAWMNKAFTEGFAEFNSPHYGGFYLSPLLMLFDFSNDKEIKTHAEMLIWRILGDYLIHYNYSVICGASSRVADQDIFNKKNSDMAQLMGFFMGDKPVNKSYHSLFFALSKFKFPETLYEMYKDNQKWGGAELDMERDMAKIDSYGGKAERLTTYLYSDSLYSLGSIIDGNNDEIQTRTWSLDWAGRRKNNTLFGLNPYMSKTALSAYFPGNIDTTYKNILKQRPFYTDSNKWIGGSPYEDLFQYKNVLLGMYDFADTLKNNSVSFFISNDIDSVWLENNTLYAKTQSIYFALHFSTNPVITNVEYGKRYRIRGNRPSFVLEVYNASDYKSFDKFRKKMKQESIYLSVNGVIYKSNNGTKMLLNPSGEKLLNGKAIQFPSDTVYKSRGMNIANGIMTIKTGDENAVLDWGKQKITYLKIQ